MKMPKLIRQLTSHLITLFVGVILAFGGLQILSSQAEPAPDILPLNSPTTIAQASIPTQDTESFVSTAVARTGPAVVRIDTERVVSRRIPSLDQFSDDPFFGQFFGDRFSSQIPNERRITGQGSGFIIDSNGIILTNAHVVSKADRVTVTLKDGRSFEGEVRGTDEVTDLAVVKVDAQGQNLPIASLGNSSNVKVGDWAIAVGNPVGLNNTVTLGIISTLERSSAQAGIPDKRVDFLQTDAAINPGNSGGPLLNAKGEVIGINTAIRADAMGIGFAIPIDKAKSLKDILARGQEVPHPFVGIQMVTLTSELAQENNQDPNSDFVMPEVDGVLVVGVLPNTPAEAAGIRRGDVIVRVNNQSVTDAGELQSIVERSGVDQVLRFNILRGNQRVELPVRTAQLGRN